MPLAPQTRVGPFEILSLHGSGGMGEVYRARDTRLDREVALKVLPADAVADATARARLLREARLASQLNHPHTCTIHEVGESDPSTGSGQAVAYIAMELVGGQPLSAMLAGGALPTEQVLRFGSQIADALAHAHARGLAEAEKAVLLDPFNPKVLSFQAQVLLSARRYDDAIAAARAAQKLQPNAPVARTAVLGSLFGKGEFEEAYRGELEHFGSDPELKSALERGHAEAGYRGAAKRLADVLAGRFGKPGGTGAFHLANLYVHAGDRERTLEWLQRAYEARDPNIPYTPSGPQWDLVRADPRFQDLVRRIGLPQ